jgi:SAM-dependent methyltransferase
VTAGHCPACDGPLAHWRCVPAGEPSDPRRFELLRCGACASAVTVGEPPGPEAYERGVYAPDAPRAPRLVGALQGLVVGQAGRALRRAGLTPGARVLDVGAGRGRLVDSLAASSYVASGIEPSARSADAAAAAGRMVHRVGIEDHVEHDLDALVLWHVLEHLDDPRAALARMRAWLRPGGLALVGVPNPASLQARIAGAAWMHWDAPRHRVHLTPRGLSALLVSAGFEPLHTEHLVWEHNPAAMWMALLSRLGLPPALPFHLLKRTAEARPRDLALLGLAGVPLLAPALALETVAAAGRRGGTVVVVARVRGAHPASRA